MVFVLEEVWFSEGDKCVSYEILSVLQIKKFSLL